MLNQESGYPLRPRWGNRGITVTQSSEHIHVSSLRDLRCVSSGIHGGGLHNLHHVFNFKVSKQYDCRDPKQDLENRITRMGVESDDVTALMTAAMLEDAGWVEAAGSSWNLFVCVTAGFSNAARVSAKPLTQYRPGTINIIVMVDGCLTDEALVESVITATEAKAAALQDLGIRCLDGRIATGTTTDAVVIGAICEASEISAGGCWIEYTGLATEFGNRLSEAVYEALFSAGRKYLDRLGGVDA